MKWIAKAEMIEGNFQFPDKKLFHNRTIIFIYEYFWIAKKMLFWAKSS